MHHTAKQCPGWRRPCLSSVILMPNEQSAFWFFAHVMTTRPVFSAHQLNKPPAEYSVTVTPYVMTAIRERQPCSKTSFCGWLPATCFAGLNGIPSTYFNLRLNFTGTRGHRSSTDMSIPPSSQHFWRHNYLYKGTVHDARHSMLLSQSCCCCQFNYPAMWRKNFIPAFQRNVGRSSGGVKRSSQHCLIQPSKW